MAHKVREYTTKELDKIPDDAIRKFFKEQRDAGILCPNGLQVESPEVHRIIGPGGSRQPKDLGYLDRIIGPAPGRDCAGNLRGGASDKMVDKVVDLLGKKEADLRNKAVRR